MLWLENAIAAGLSQIVFCICRFDWLSKKNVRNGYFIWAMMAYGLGMTNILYGDTNQIPFIIYDARNYKMSQYNSIRHKMVKD